VKLTLQNQSVSLLAAYISIVSILAVYHMFALQSWVESCGTAEATADVVIATTTSDDLARLRSKASCEAALRRYPWSQIFGVLTVLALISALGISVALDVRTISFLYTGGPVCAVLAIVVFATVASTWRTRRSIHRVLREL